eukprot:scaffold52051_cov46-Prasinocladus_malaysianus.AAC.1
MIGRVSSALNLRICWTGCLSRGAWRGDVWVLRGRQQRRLCSGRGQPSRNRDSARWGADHARAVCPPG